MDTIRRSTHRELIEAVAAIPGVRGVEPGVASTLRTLDARIRRDREQPGLFGVIVDDEARVVTLELGLGEERPVRSIVTDVQHAAQECLSTSQTQDYGIHVRVQSLSR